MTPRRRERTRTTITKKRRQIFLLRNWSAIWQDMDWEMLSREFKQPSLLLLLL